MSTLTLDQLKQICVHAGEDLLLLHLPFIQGAMDQFEVNTPIRMAYFLAQWMLECDECREMREVWNPDKVPDQKNYEPPSHTATRLGNTQPGDGYKFRGGGPAEITGRRNYQFVGDALGIDLVNQPELIEQPDAGWKAAGLYWGNGDLNHTGSSLNALADIGDFQGVTKSINGGLTDYDLRLKYLSRASAALGA